MEEGEIVIPGSHEGRLRFVGRAGWKHPETAQNDDAQGGAAARSAEPLDVPPGHGQARQGGECERHDQHGSAFRLPVLVSEGVRGRGGGQP